VATVWLSVILHSNFIPYVIIWYASAIWSMESLYLEQLGPDVRRFAGRIEQEADIEIGIRVEPARIDRCNSLACEVDEEGAVILVPTPGHFPDGAALHELLHIERFLVQGVPRIEACESFPDWSPGLETALRSLDNRIEHLVIVPHELRSRPDRRDHWERVMRNALDDLPGAGIADYDRRRLAMMDWAFAVHVLPPSDLRDRYSEYLDALGVSIEARIFLGAIVPALDSKEDLVRLCFEHLELPRGCAVLSYIDIETRRTEEVPI
jgi:hypothetical protein